jgi:hypothetical protein
MTGTHKAVSSYLGTELVAVSKTSWQVKLIVTMDYAETVSTEQETRCLDSDNCCTPGVDCPVCSARRNKKQRIRREIRTLSPEAYSRVVSAIITLKRRTKGTNYDYFVAKQMAAYYDSRGDQTSTGTSFFTWHSLFLLEFEEELLKIDPSIGALPYWDWADPSPPAFTKGYFGLKPGQDRFYQVIDGPFQFFKVGDIDSETWSTKIVPNYTTSYAELAPGTAPSYINFTGDTASGTLRGVLNTNINDYVTRQEPYSLDMDGERCNAYNRTDPLELGLSEDCGSKDFFPFTAWQTCMTGNNFFDGPPWDNISLISTPLQFVSNFARCAQYCAKCFLVQWKRKARSCGLQRESRHPHIPTCQLILLVFIQSVLQSAHMLMLIYHHSAHSCASFCLLLFLSLSLRWAAH